MNIVRRIMYTIILVHVWKEKLTRKYLMLTEKHPFSQLEESFREFLHLWPHCPFRRIFLPGKKLILNRKTAFMTCNDNVKWNYNFIQKVEITFKLINKLTNFTRASFIVVGLAWKVRKRIAFICQLPRNT